MKKLKQGPISELSDTITKIIYNIKNIQNNFSKQDHAPTNSQSKLEFLDFLYTWEGPNLTNSSWDPIFGGHRGVFGFGHGENMGDSY